MLEPRPLPSSLDISRVVSGPQWRSELRQALEDHFGTQHEAVVAAQRAADLGPDSAAALGNLAAALAQSGRAKEALPVIHRALELDPSDWKNQQIRDRVQAAASKPEP